jgi:hypothetical protein
VDYLKKIGSTIEKATKNIDNEIKARQERERVKKQILDRFEMWALKKICRDYGIGEPSEYEEDPETGRKRKRVVTRKEYVSYVQKNLNLDQIKKFAYKNRIDISDIVEEEKEIKKSEEPRVRKKDTEQKETEQKKPEPVKEEKVIVAETETGDELGRILNDIEANFPSISGRDEREFEKQLLVYLRNRYPNKKIIEQMRTSAGTVDIGIDEGINGKYAIELKVAYNKSTLQNLVGQIHGYLKDISIKKENLGIVLIDGKFMEYDRIKEYVKDYRDFGVRTIVLSRVIDKGNKHHHHH